jgi:hypothetical protein
MRSLMICTQNKYYWCDYITEEMHGTYGTYCGQGKYILDFGVESSGPLGKTEHKWVNIIKMDLKETG